MSTPTRSVRIANCSGFYGDRLTAMREMLDGGPVDYLTGDYLAELTMLILGRAQLKDASLGYAKTFVTQVEDCLGDALERGVRIVSNAGGMNPAGLAERLREVASGLGLDPVIAHVEGDNISARAEELGLGRVLTANAYLGGFGIAHALDQGADVVVTGRVTDASVVVGAGIAEHGWTPTSYDALAGAVVAGHVIECGPQACGGNFSGFARMPLGGTPLGFPVAELAADGSSVITKHDDTGGVVTRDTVTAQLMYEIQSATYLNPDVAVDLSSIALSEEGPDRVRVSGVAGSAPPAMLKVSTNVLGGFRNRMEFVVTGLDVEAKVAWVREQVETRLRDQRPEIVGWTLGRLPEADAETEEAASCLLRLTVKDPSADVVGRAFSAAAVELALASYPGFNMTSPPGDASPYGVYRPAYVARDAVEQVVVIGDERTVVPDPPELSQPGAGVSTSSATGGRAGCAATDVETAAPDRGPTQRLPLGTFVHARSGDKGGDANVGLWVGQDDGADADRRDARVAWLLGTVSPQWVHDLLPETRGLAVEVHPLENLGGVNVMVRGLLGEGVAESSRFDPQAKALGEWLRSRLVDVPEGLL